MPCWSWPARIGRPTPSSPGRASCWPRPAPPRGEHPARRPGLTAAGATVTVVALGDGTEGADVVRRHAGPGGYLLIGTPPLLECTEALRLAADVDAVLVVARQDRTTHAELPRRRELVATAGVPPVGSILLDARGLTSAPR